MQYLNDKIIDAMKRKHITYTMLAAQLGVARSTAWRKMHRPEMWTAGELEQIAKFLDIDFAIYR